MQKKRIGERRNRRAALFAAFAILLAGPFLASAGFAQASAPDLDALLKRIAANNAREVPFEESRFIGAVAVPLVSRGTLRFEPPDRLIKKTETPTRETATVDESRLSVRNADGVETASIDLWVSEDLRLVFDSLRAVLRGDAGILRSLFDVALAGDGNAWTLTLTPKSNPDATRIERIVVSGISDRIRSFDIRESDGGRSLLRMLDAPDRP